jgi:hypothetical protein
MAQGKRLGAAATALGVGVGTLERWIEAATPSSQKLRQVDVVESDEVLDEGRNSGLGLTLATASGHRVEGLTLAEVALLLEALG